MKLITSALLLLLSSACTSLMPIELAPEQLHEKILTDNIIREGDNVQIITSDGMRHEFKVTSVTQNQIIGKDNNIPILDILALSKSGVSSSKTSAFVGGTFLWILIILLSLPVVVAL